MEGADLVITNCHMPDMDGPTFVRTLREGKFTQPIIMVSGSDEARRLGAVAGVDRFIEKRYLDPDLAHAIHKLLKGTSKNPTYEASISGKKRIEFASR